MNLKGRQMSLELTRFQADVACTKMFNSTMYEATALLWNVRIGMQKCSG